MKIKNFQQNKYKIVAEQKQKIMEGKENELSKNKERLRNYENRLILAEKIKELILEKYQNSN